MWANDLIGEAQGLGRKKKTAATTAAEKETTEGQEGDATAETMKKSSRSKIEANGSAIEPCKPSIGDDKGSGGRNLPLPAWPCPDRRFPIPLDGWNQNLLEVQDILDKHGLKSLFSFSPAVSRGVPIHFNAHNGRSLLPCTNGDIIYLDSEPQNSMVKPVIKILVGVVILKLLIAVFVRETPEWFKASASKFSGSNFPPWILACVVIVFTRTRKRTRLRWPMACL